IGAPNVHLYTHANVCELEPNESLRSIEGLRVRTLDGKEHRARARYYVLACCSIQNARLLLASNRRTPTGLGNAYDLVGRFFMEHIEMPGGHLALAPSRAMNTKMYAMEFGQTKARGELAGAGAKPGLASPAQHGTRCVGHAAREARLAADGARATVLPRALRGDGAGAWPERGRSGPVA